MTRAEGLLERALPATTLNPSRLADGLTFAHGGNGDEGAVWGSPEAVAWAPGEATLLVGPDGVGKTTIAQRLALGRAGVERELLGMRIEPADGKVLYVAADRPKQAARSMYRMLPDLDRRQHGLIREGLLVWRGPLPFDVARNPSQLAAWASELDAQDVFLDSLGFVASRLADDETGSALAMAFATLNAAGIELFVLGHPRKANGKNVKPNAIADVYGSRWITAACGSVLSLWADPGDPVIELRHLKAPAGEVGPFLVELDHARGTVAVVEGTDLLGHLRASTAGLSAKEAARFMEGATPKAREVKARRRLDRLVADRLAYCRDGASITGGIRESGRYFATPPEVCLPNDAEHRSQRSRHP